MIPLGTGNDAARYFGWGPKLRSEQVLRTYIHRMLAVDPVVELWDRWRVYVSIPTLPDPSRKLGAFTENMLDPFFENVRKYGRLTPTEYDSRHLGLHEQHSGIKSVDEEKYGGYDDEIPITVAGDDTTTKDKKGKDDQGGEQGDDKSKEKGKAPVEAKITSEKEGEKVAVEGENEGAKDKSYMVGEDDGKKGQGDHSGDEGDVTDSLTKKQVGSSSTDSNSNSILRYTWAFNNYFSFGVDAQTMHSLHKHRENNRCCHQCRCCTMCWIGLLNTCDCITCANPDLNIQVEYLIPKPKDDPPSSSDFPGGYKWVPSKEATEHQIGAFVMTNLPNYAAGRSAWGRDTNESNQPHPRDVIRSYTSPDVNDGRLEVVAFDGYNHLAQMTLCGSRGYRLAQTHGVRVKVLSKCYVQIDGEAWTLDRGMVEVLRAPSALMIRNSPPDAPAACDC